MVGLVAARLIGRLGERAWEDSSRQRFDYGRDARMAERQNGSLKAHGDKMGNALRAAASGNRAPTYPEG